MNQAICPFTCNPFMRLHGNLHATYEKIFERQKRIVPIKTHTKIMNAQKESERLFTHPSITCTNFTEIQFPGMCHLSLNPDKFKP